MSTRCFHCLLLATLVVLGGCSQPSLPVKRHSATRPLPLIGDNQVALVTADMPIPDRLPDLAVGAIPPIPAIKPYQQWTEQEVAAEAIGRIGKAAVPELRRSLASPDPKVRLQSIEVLARVGSEAKDAVPDLVERLDDENPLVRRAAARTLGQIGPDAADAVPALMRSLHQPQPLPPTE